LQEEIAVVLRSEVIAERRYFFTAILKVRADGLYRAENEGEGAHDQQDNRKVGHSVLLCIEKPRKLERRGQAGGLIFTTLTQAAAEELVKIAHFGTIMRRSAKLLGESFLLLLSPGTREVSDGWIRRRAYRESAGVNATKQPVDRRHGGPTSFWFEGDVRGSFLNEEA
jgi:hypothetical protein